jgi:hypothetical protein
MQQEIINRITTMAQNIPLDDVAISTLRETFPEVHFTYCSDDDISGPDPVEEFDAFNLYLVDGNEHCLKFTNNLDSATGVVIAEVYEDDN